MPPGSTIVFGDNPSFDYELSGPNTSAWFVPRPRAYCARPGEPCAAGFVRASAPAPIDDDLCGPTERDIRRCVAQGEVQLVSTVPSIATPPGDANLSLAELSAGVHLSPRDFDFAMVCTGRETVALVVGSGEHWRLAIDGGGTTR